MYFAVDLLHYLPLTYLSFIMYCTDNCSDNCINTFYDLSSLPFDSNLYYSPILITPLFVLLPYLYNSVTCITPLFVLLPYLQLTFVDSMAEMFGPILAGVPLWAPPPLFIRENGVVGA